MAISPNPARYSTIIASTCQYVKQLNVKIITHLSPVPKLRTCGDTPPLTLYALMTPSLGTVTTSVSIHVNTRQAVTEWTDRPSGSPTAFLSPRLGGGVFDCEIKTTTKQPYDRVTSKLAANLATQLTRVYGSPTPAANVWKVNKPWIRA